jgi:predicted metalloprotease with PDZ domain
MHKSQITLLLLFFSLVLHAQVSTVYTVSFENAAHHEAEIKATFHDLKSKTIEFRMSRSSPGRYALHEFVKNVYNVKVTDSKGLILKTTRPNPYVWHVKGHDGTINVSYTLYANHGDGTYAQVDETHAHLNIPATFMYVPELSENEIEVTFKVREDLDWKVATQLKHQEGNTFYAKNLQYFMDSPVEISNYNNRSFTVDDQTINLVLHDDNATEENIDAYFENIKKIVLQEKAVFGALPKYDYGAYTFLACYMPNVTGDGMEHRNSTILTSTRSLSKGGIEQNIGTLAHEFFHCWNVERIRPQALEPFNFTEANMSGELWFAEGFTSYYDTLSRVRAGVCTAENYLSDMARNFNAVWTAPGRQFFNPIEMSYQAPFVDAAKSVDEQNRGNTFISYYSYGEMLGLALDLSLREQNLNLDDYMKLVWNAFGKVNRFYSVKDLHHTLNSYAGKDFGDAFFNKYIYKSEMPDFDRLFKNVGIKLEAFNTVSFGAFVRHQKLMNNPKLGTTAYEAGFQKGDTIIKVGDFTLNSVVSVERALSKYKVGENVIIAYERFDELRKVEVLLKSEVSYSLTYLNLESNELTEKTKQNKALWLGVKEKHL